MNRDSFVDYPEPPRGIAVFACLKPGAPVEAFHAAIAHAAIGHKDGISNAYPIIRA